MDIQGKIENNVGIVKINQKTCGGDDNKLVFALVKKFAGSGIKNIIIDLSMVTMMSSMGIGTLLACHTMLTKIEGKLVIAQPSEQIIKLLNMNQLINIVNVIDTVEEAYKTYGIE
jgi:anti-sigma B factor antagonist